MSTSTKTAKTTKTTKTQPRWLPECKVLDARFSRPNKILARTVDNQLKPGIYRDKSVKEFSIVPDTCYFGQKFCTILFSLQDLAYLLLNHLIVVASELDTGDTHAQAIGQRYPNTDRVSDIFKAWQDPEVYPDEKTETIQLYVYGAEMTNQGIKFGENSTIVANDGAGRLCAAFASIKGLLSDQRPLTDHVLAKRGIRFHALIDFSADKKKMLREFLLWNKEGTSVNNNTALGVAFAEIPEQYVPKTYDEKFAIPWVLKSLNDECSRVESLLSFITWSSQGHAVKKQSLENPQGLVRSYGGVETAIKELRKFIDFDKYAIPVALMHPFLDFTLRQFYILCPNLVNDLKVSRKNMLQRGGDGKPIAPKMFSTLGLKVMILTSLGAVGYLGNDLLSDSGDASAVADYRKFIQSLFTKHMKRYKIHYRVSGNRKKMTPEEFFMTNEFFTSTMFNSGAKNTTAVVQQFCDCIETMDDTDLQV